MTNEEKIELRNKCGIRDPTPYEAVMNMVREQERRNEMIARASIAARERTVRSSSTARSSATRTSMGASTAASRGIAV